jgi:aldehyde oxidoreductase
MEFILNGVKKNYDGDPGLSLLTYLREVEGITSAKDGCSGQGACGCCMVMLDERAILSCTIPMSRVQGKSVTTTEGLKKNVQDAFADAFVEKGGIQCGFCTPGIVMNASALLARNANPSQEEIKKTLSANLCRCTGYKKIIDSIEAAANKLSDGKQATGCCRDSENAPATGKVGSRHPKYQGRETVLGFRPFVADMKEPGMLHCALKMSDHPRARVLSIDTSAAEKLAGVVRIFKAADVCGDRITGLIFKDWPLMIAEGEETRYLGDVLCQVVAESEAIARQAVKLVRVEYEVLTPVCSAQEAMAAEAPQIHIFGNILSETKIKRGDADAALAASAHVVTAKYTTQRIEHAFMEPECCLARPWTYEGQPGVEIFSQGQGVYEDRKQLASLLALPLERVNVVQVQNGGGFGGKEDLTTQGHAALCAWLLQKPVRVAFTREESMIFHPKRHPFEMDYTLGCDAQGKLTALKARLICDSGAYASVGMKVLERAVAHSAGGYTVPVVDIHGTAVCTNNIPCGAMRGFGANQATFAMECAMEELCEKGGFDRWQFRWDNAIVDGTLTVTGQRIERAAGIRACLEALKDQFREAKHAGLAVGIKNTGVGCGMPDVGSAKIVIEGPEKVVVHHGWTEMGQGVYTMALQTLVEETGIDPSFIEVRVATSEETRCGMTTSSRGTSLVGHSVIVASKELKEDLKKHTLAELVGREYRGEWVCDWTSKVGHEKPGKDVWTHYSYGYAAQLVEIGDNGKIKMIWAAHDAGRIMNPNLFEGQIEGALHMGLGYALSEDFPMKDGRPLHTKLLKCGIIRSKNMPPVEVIGVEVADPHGPYGVKGVGEIGLVPTAGAVALALHSFDGVWRRSLPLEGGKDFLS